MSKSPPTRSSLLFRVRDTTDSVAWAEFVHIYAPLIHAYGLKRGLQDADAADLAQDVLTAISKVIQSFDYEPDRGSFRGWLFTITLNRLRKLVNQRQSQFHGSGESGVRDLLNQFPDAETAEEEWNREHEDRLFRWASEYVKDEVSPSTWSAFWHTAVLDQDPKQVAESLGMSTGAIYVSKSRVIAKIRERIQSVENE